jgi:hypothetical protein
LARDPVGKIVERIPKDSDIHSMMTGIFMMVLDLEHHPENASTYAVEIMANTVPVTTNTPAPVGMEHRLLQIVTARRVANANAFAEIVGYETQETMRKMGGSLPRDTSLVCVVFRSQHNPRLFSLSCH